MQGILLEPPAVEVDLHGGGVKGGAVLELDTAAKRERPYLAIRRRGPRGRQRRTDLERAAAIGRKALHRGARDVERHAVGHHGRIELDRVLVAPEDQRRRVLLGRAAARREHRSYGSARNGARKTIGERV